MSGPIPKYGFRATRLESGVMILSYDVDIGEHVAAALEPFSQAERAVIRMALGGSSDDEIAEQRGCSRHTVANLLRSAYRRAGVNSRAELAAWLTAESDDADAACGESERG